LVESYKICPICQTANASQASVCMNCGTTLADVLTAQSATTDNKPTYDFRYGETDLMESSLTGIARVYMLVATVILLLLMGGGLTLAFAPSIVDDMSQMPLPFIGADEDTATPSPRPTFGFATVTPAPPTNTPTITPTATPTPLPTETPAPCLRTVESGNSLFELAVSCGHENFAVINVIVELNDLADANAIRPGQELIIPWPTEQATEPPPPAENDGSTGANDTTAGSDVVVSDNSNNTDEQDPLSDDFDPFFVPTPTLRPGIQFHAVISGDTMISIAQIYNANAEILSQLNPEIPFGGCDFGQRYGGPECVVNLSPGQQMRVPAPTPTPTLSPTPSGSETATPTATATFNAPSPQSPTDRSLFRANELVTLRWVPSGTLGPNETYRITVENITDGVVYVTDTTETAYLLPQEWQAVGEDRAEYRWIISVIDRDNPSNPSYTTEPLTFIWEARAEDE